MLICISLQPHCRIFIFSSAREYLSECTTKHISTHFQELDQTGVCSGYSGFQPKAANDYFLKSQFKKIEHSLPFFFPNICISGYKVHLKHGFICDPQVVFVFGFNHFNEGLRGKSQRAGKTMRSDILAEQGSPGFTVTEKQSQVLHLV